MEELINIVVKLAGQSSFRGDDLITMKNLYSKYINANHQVCMTCPGSVNHMINVFKNFKDITINKIKKEYGTEK